MILFAIMVLFLLPVEAIADEYDPVFLATSSTGLVEILQTRMESRDSQFRIRLVWSYSFGDVQTLIDQALADALHQSGDYLTFNFIDRSVNGYGMDGDTTYDFDITYCTTVANEAAVDTEISSIIASLRAGLETDEQLSRAIYDWVVGNISHGVGYGAYEALNTGEAAYTGFCLLVQRLHDEAGIPCRIVPEVGVHAWNLVNLCGQWYHLDTWYQRYNLTDDEIAVFNSWNTTNYPSAARAYAYPVCPMAPTVNAGPDLNVNEKTSVNLNGANSTDPNNDIVSYTWSQVSGTSVNISNSDTVVAEILTPDVDITGEALVFELSVADSEGNTSADEVIVNVTWCNEAPVADAGEDLTVGENIAVVLSADSSSDSDDGIESYRWDQISGPSVVLENADSMRAEFNSPIVTESGTALEFELTVTDCGGLRATDRNAINISHTNTAPTAVAGASISANGGDRIQLDASGSSDMDGNIVSYCWRQISGPGVTLSNTHTAEPEVTLPQVTETTVLTFEVAAFDDGGLEATDQVEVTAINSEDSPSNLNSETGSNSSSGGCFIITINL